MENSKKLGRVLELVHSVGALACKGARDLDATCEVLQIVNDDPNFAERLLGQKQAIGPGSVIPLGAGWRFTVDEIMEFTVDDSLSSDEIAKRHGLDLKRDWKYVGTPPKSGTRTVKAVIGRLNKSWTEEQVTELLSEPGCPLKGSGAWVREAFLAARPRYDGNDWIGFPDAQTSRWRDRRSDGVYFPFLWGVGDGWDRDLFWVRDEYCADDRLCLLCG